MNIIGDRYQIDPEILGSGGFSVVHLGKDLRTGDMVAIKKVSLTQANLRDDKSKLNLAQEVELMQSLQHPNIVSFLDIIRTPTEWYIMMEYCSGGTLKNIIDEHRVMVKGFGSEVIKEENTRNYLSQLCSALAYLRRKGYYHRDLKPANILLARAPGDESGFVVKLADFGLSKCFEDAEEMTMTVCGSPYYMAPEIIIDKNYNSQADLWSIGIIMYEMLFGTLPYTVKTIRELTNCLRNESIDFHSEKNYSPECFSLLKLLLTKKADSRISWEEFFSHPWFGDRALSLSSAQPPTKSRTSQPVTISRASHREPSPSPSPSPVSFDSFIRQIGTSKPSIDPFEPRPSTMPAPALSNTPSGLSRMKGSIVFRSRTGRGQTEHAFSCPEPRPPPVQNLPVRSPSNPPSGIFDISG